MKKTCKTYVLAAAALALSAGAASAASPMSGFGPTVSGDRSLAENLGVLTQVVAWQNSPYGDVYQLALATPAPEMPFENVAMASSSQDSLPIGPQIVNDRTLNASLGELALVIAWQKSPEGDAFQYALEDHVKGADFQQVALASIPAGGFGLDR